MTDTSASNSAAARAQAQAERLEAAKKSVEDIRGFKGRIGLAIDDIRVPTLNDKGDFFWRGRELKIDGMALTQAVDRFVKAGKLGPEDPVKYDGGEAVRGENGKFASFSVPTRAKMDNEIIQLAAFKTLMLDRGRQFLADKDNIALLRNQKREVGVDGVAKSQPLSGMKALMRNNGDKTFYAFIDKGDLIKRMEKQPAIAPYIAEAVKRMNENYMARSERLKTNAQGVSNER